MPSVTLTATPPPTMGTPAATRVPNTSSSTTRAMGIVYVSAVRTSWVVTCWMSSKMAGSPVK